MRKTLWFFIVFALLIGCRNGAAKPVPPALNILAYDTGAGAILIAGSDRQHWLSPAECADRVGGYAGTWLADKQGAIEPVTLAVFAMPQPADKNQTRFQIKQRNIQSYFLSRHVWQKVLTPLDYNSLELRKKIAHRLIDAGGEDCAPCLGLFGSGSFNIAGDERSETLYVVETDEWVGVFVEFPDGEWITVDGHATSAADALEMAGADGDPAKLWHHTYEVPALIDLDYDKNFELLVRENRFREEAISLFAVAPAGAKLLARQVVKIN
ncbi:MAG TPA: hypothetical protein PK961_04250 [bacterium]|nr:hypothetical protein [bacterium]